MKYKDKDKVRQQNNLVINHTLDSYMVLFLSFLTVFNYIKNLLLSISRTMLLHFTKIKFIQNNLKENFSCVMCLNSTRLLLGIGVTLPAGIDEEVAQHVASWILQGCTKDEVLNAVESTFERTLSFQDLIQIIAWSLAKGLIKILDLTEHFTSVLPELPELPSGPSLVDLPHRVPEVNIPNEPDIHIPSGSPRVEPVSSSRIETVVNFVSEHKVAILVGTVALVATGIVIYLIWKRRGPTPPPESGVSIPQKAPVKSDQSIKASSLNTFSQYSIILWFLSLSLLFSLYSLTTLINYAYSS